MDDVLQTFDKMNVLNSPQYANQIWIFATKKGGDIKYSFIYMTLLEPKEQILMIM
jgi:hypothetical protein